jgi:hypothetical protein
MILVMQIKGLFWNAFVWSGRSTEFILLSSGQNLVVRVDNQPEKVMQVCNGYV